MIFNGPVKSGKGTIIFYAIPQQIINTRYTIPASLEKTPGKYGYKLVTKIPDLRPIPDIPPVALTYFTVKVGGTWTKKGKTVNYIDSPKSCPQDGFPFHGDYTYSDGQKLTTDTAIPCPPGA